MSFVVKLGKTRIANLYLVRGNSGGQPAWYYVQVHPLKKPIFDRQLKSGSIDLAVIGRVLVSGWGKDPPDDVKKRMKDNHGFEGS